MIKHACPEILNTKHQSPLSLIPSLISIIRLQDLLRMCLVLPKKTTTKTYTFKIRILFQQFSFFVSNLNNLFQSTVSAHDLEFPTSIPPKLRPAQDAQQAWTVRHFTKYICNCDMYIVVYTDYCVYIYSTYVPSIYVVCKGATEMHTCHKLPSIETPNHNRTPGNSSTCQVVKLPCHCLSPPTLAWFAPFQPPVQAKWKIFWW